MKKGFTLSEVLIALSIVGIVAVLTIPSVMKNYSNRLYVSQLQKAYNEISEAAQSIMNDEHTDNFKETLASAKNPAGCPGDMTKCTEGPMYFLTHYFKSIKKNCGGTHSDRTCAKHSDFYKSLDNVTLNSLGADSCILTASGVTICAGYNPNESVRCLSLLVDVNGLSEPNVAGRDVFSMDVHSNGSLSDWGSACIDNHKGWGKNSCGIDKNGSLIQAAAGCLNSVIDAGWKIEY